jgi:hypothetical protein
MLTATAWCFSSMHPASLLLYIFPLSPSDFRSCLRSQFSGGVLMKKDTTLSHPVIVRQAAPAAAGGAAGRQSVHAGVVLTVSPLSQPTLSHVRFAVWLQLNHT